MHLTISFHCRHVLVVIARSVVLILHILALSLTVKLLGILLLPQSLHNVILTPTAIVVIQVLLVSTSFIYRLVEVVVRRWILIFVILLKII